MRRLGRIAMLAAASVIVVGTIASASPAIRSTFHPSRAVTSTTGATGSTGEPAGLSGATGPSGASGASGAVGDPQPADPVETEEPVDEAAGTGPDFSSCAGLTGLDNAVCRHEVLLALDPDNAGLQNALDHLRVNQARHADGDDPSSIDDGADDQGEEVPADDQGEDHGQSGEDHGQSGEDHGQSGEDHGQSGEDHGNGH